MYLALRLILHHRYLNFINIRPKNSGTSSKKSSRKFRYNEIPRVHIMKNRFQK